jgi:hypothetical protein
MNMDEQQELYNSIQAFLLSKGYDTRVFKAVRMEFVEIAEDGQRQRLISKLKKFLSLELGRNWQQVFRGMTLIRESLHQDFGFSEAEWDDIRSAFAFYLLLEPNSDKE